MPARILVVDDEARLRSTLVRLLESRGYECATAGDGDEALDMAISFRADLVLMDLVMPRRSGVEALADLRGNFRTRFVPVIFLTARSDLTERVSTLLAGADDYVLKPYVAEELFARIHVALARAKALRDVNPLTGLPGNRAIQGEIEALGSERTPFDLVYVDLNRFKAFNDRYGFARGDLMLGALAQVLADGVAAIEQDPRFVGHVGGDDFVVIVPAGRGVGLAEDVIRRFEGVAPSLYNPADQERGFIEVETRTGTVQAPLASVSIAIVPLDASRDLSLLALAEVVSEMKQVAKRKGPGSAWAVDQRDAGRRSLPKDEPRA